MLKKVQPYIALLFLTTFLFPALLKDIHALHHHEHEICIIVSDYHFHEHHAECKCCDQILPVTETPSAQTVSFVAFQFADYSYKLFLADYSDSFFSPYSQLRGPPFVA